MITRDDLVDPDLPPVARAGGRPREVRRRHRLALAPAGSHPRHRGPARRPRRFGTRHPHDRGRDQRLRACRSIDRGHAPPAVRRLPARTPLGVPRVTRSRSGRPAARQSRSYHPTPPGGGSSSASTGGAGTVSGADVVSVRVAPISAPSTIGRLMTGRVDGHEIDRFPAAAHPDQQGGAVEPSDRRGRLRGIGQRRAAPPSGSARSSRPDRRTPCRRRAP